MLPDYGKLPPKIAAMTDHRRATLLVNPAAGGAARFDAPGALAYLQRLGLEAQLTVPSSRSEATAEAARSAGRGDDLLFVAGGDGSLRDAAEGLAGSPTALAPIPAGTVNVLAREIGLPRGARAAIDSHLAGQRVAMDIGRADGRGFLLMAGVGWDAAIARTVTPGLKRCLGDVAYLLRGAAMLPGLRPVTASWTADGQPRKAPLSLMVVGNTRLYGGLVRFTPDAVANDGYLDIVALCPRNVFDALRLGARILANRLEGDQAVRAVRARIAQVETPGLPVQLDGDVVGETPMQFTVEALALLLSVPAGPLPALFARPPNPDLTRAAPK